MKSRRSWSRPDHLECVVERPADLPEVFNVAIDCVVAAGGDGTVARAGCALAGGDIPLAILPLGTANNIASSLGISGSLEEAIAAWRHQRIVRIDVGVIQHDGETRFLESVGAGLVVAGIKAGDAAIPKNGDPVSNVAHARGLYLETIQHLQPRHCDITLDGTSIAGDYLLIESEHSVVGPGSASRRSGSRGWIAVGRGRDRGGAPTAPRSEALQNGGRRAPGSSPGAPATSSYEGWRISCDDDVRTARGARDDRHQAAALAVMA